MSNTKHTKHIGTLYLDGRKQFSMTFMEYDETSESYKKMLKAMMSGRTKGWNYGPGFKSATKAGWRIEIERVDIKESLDVSRKD